ncbi:T9SS type A sorting domain-containing protein [Hymenobacter sp. BT18]|uniref:T9SS type A sorting domain-containing protein n=1 Tax=Hymenobacter sp. BT18 TaxID=2835648 RepID=UPI00143E230B|nr:T9SS type A sorting domain-containing protein [Hymenobacter sp. BT18]QIX61973.1 T9SS type A sorting domain-containing protein [Hymenobacter sp. BT18]
MKKQLLALFATALLPGVALYAQVQPEPLLPDPIASAARATAATVFQPTQLLEQTYALTDWKNKTRTVLQKFAGPNQPQLSVVDAWDGNAWKPSLYSHLRYTPDGQMKTDTFFTYQPGNPKAFAYLAIAQSFNSARQLTERVTSALNIGTTKWVPVSRAQISYTNGLATQQVEQSYDYGTEKYLNVARSLYSYNASKQQTQHEQQKLENNAWVKLQRYDNTYTATGKLAQQQLSRPVNNMYEVMYRFTFSYDAADRVTKILTEEKKAATWVSVQQTVYAYDGKGNPASYTEQAWSGTAFVNARRVLITGQLVTANQAAQARQFQLTVAPNPAHGAAQVQYTLASPATVAAQVFDGVGREVVRLASPQQQGIGRQSLLVPATLQPGLYVVRLSINDEVVQTKLVVQ